MEALESVYLICFFFGLAFVFISFLLGGVFGGANGAGGDFGHGGDGGIGGDGGGGHGGDAGHGHSWAIPPFFSPFTLSFFAAAFGGGGIVSRRVLEWAPASSVVTAAACGIVFAMTAMYLLDWIRRASTSSSQPTVADLLGKEAEVTVTIPSRGVGQISYEYNGRQTAPARAIDDNEIAARSTVKIRSILGNTFFVERIP